MLAPLLSCRPVPDTGQGKPLSITEVIDRIDELDGRSVRVAGYLTECMGYESPLFLSDQDSARWRRYREQLVRRRSPPEGEKPPVLGIGSQNDFDRKAAPF